jgi:hypothetical protein
VLTLARRGIPDFPICGQSESGPPGPFPVPGRRRIGKRGRGFPIPDSGRIGNRARGFPPRFKFPAKSGIGGTGIGNFRVRFHTGW